MLPMTVIMIFAGGLGSLEFSSIKMDSGDNCNELCASLEIKYKCPVSLKVKVDQEHRETFSHYV